MKTLLAIAAALVMLLALDGGPARADIITFGGLLTPGEEIPTPTIPSGFSPLGTALSSLDTVTRVLTTNLTWTDLTTELQAAHIHNSGGNPTGPVIIPFINPPDPRRPQSGTASFTTNLTTTQYDSLVSGLQRGFIYFNIHTVLNPSGEIRADVAAQAVPEPAALTLIGISALGLVGAGLGRVRRPKALEG